MTHRKLPSRFNKIILSNTWIIAILSLIWFVFRTGTKPSRYVYPCQQQARQNIGLFGFPALIFFWHKFTHNWKYRNKVIILAISLLIASAALINLYQTINKYVALNTTSAQTTKPRVVWVRDPTATNWDFTSDYYGDHVDQNKVNTMTDNGLMSLTQTTSVGNAWKSILPNYTPGQGIAIKVNFNTVWDCDTIVSSDTSIDGLPHPVIALIRGMKLRTGGAVADNDIWIYEATGNKAIPSRFLDPIVSQFPGVRFYDGVCSGPNRYQATYNKGNLVTDVLVNATYLINVPILKAHGSDYSVSLSFKNHFGSVLNAEQYHYNLTPLVTINSNPNIKNKTVLIAADGLYGHHHSNTGSPRRWVKFNNNSPSSLFFARDPVAADSVMADVLKWNSWVGTGSDEYLSQAQNANLGVYETTCAGECCSGDTCSFTYTKIDLVRCSPTCSGVTPGTTPTITLTPTPKPGDFNSDGYVDLRDWLSFLPQFNKSNSNFNLVGTNLVNLFDFNKLLGLLFK